MIGGLSHKVGQIIAGKCRGLRAPFVAATVFITGGIAASVSPAAQSLAAQSNAKTTPPVQIAAPAQTNPAPASNAAIASRSKPANLLRGVKSWGYQLQGADPETVARSPYDLMVIDYTRAGSGAEPFSRAEVARMQRKSDGSRRFLLAYISIGEAEDYRFYWRNNWVETLELALQQPADTAADGRPNNSAEHFEAPRKRTIRIPNLMAPTWLGRESEAWSGNFAVRYWNKSWQRIIFGTKRSYLERIIKAGFDGVYIDRADAYYPLLQLRPGAERDMAQFVIRLAKHARGIKPDFLVVPQNAEELLLRPAYLAQIDAIAKEDLFYGGFGEGVENSWLQVRTSLGWLNETKKRDMPVFVIEYLDDPKLIAASDIKIKQQGFIPYFGSRALNALADPKDWTPPAAPHNAPQNAPGDCPSRFSFAATAACSTPGK